MNNIFQHIFEQAPHALMAVDRGGLVVRANRRCEQLFEAGPGELDGQPATSLLPGLSASLADDAPLIGYRRRGQPFVVDVSCSPISGDDGGLLLYTLRDEPRSDNAWPLLMPLVEHADDAVIGFDLNGLVMSWNPASEHLFGWRAEEMLGQPISTLVPVGHADEATTVMRQLQSGEPIDFWETTRLHKDGSPIVVWVRTAPITDRERRVIGGLKIVRDIRLLKRAEELRRESEERFRSAFSSAAIGMALVTVDGRLLQVNPAFCAIIGYSESELLQRNLQVLTHPDDYGKGMHLRQQLLAGEIASYQFEKRYIHREGRIIWALLTASLARDGAGQPYLISQILDISARKAAEEKLAVASRAMEEALALLDTLYGGAPAGLAFIDRDYCFVRCNDALAELNGVLTAQHIGRPVAEIVPHLWPDLRPIYDHILAGGEPIINQESSEQAGVGRRRSWLGSYYPVRLKDEIIGIGVVITEITAQKRLEEQLRQSQKMQAIGQLASGVAHDFNNLLTVINGYSDLLQIDVTSLLGPEHPASDAVSAIREAGERAALLTRQLLQLSRRRDPALTALNIGEVVGQIARLIDRLIGEDIQLITKVSPEVRPIQADHGQIEQVILNLALNARDAMPKGGRLIIEVRNVELNGARPYHVPEYQPGPYVQLSVSDSGVGMSPEVQERIFEPFYTTKEAGMGTGLGLATVYSIIEQNGGFITVYSELAIGTTFSIYLPAVSASAADAAVDVAQSYNLGGSEVVLLVEDDDGVRQIARVALETQGYQVLAARNGAEAIELSAGHPGQIDLLITDVVLPGISGHQLAAALRASRNALRVLFTSGYTSEAISRHGTPTPGDGFVQKPFTPFSLALSVRQVLDR